jgi:peptide/nickel transport system substrate-binding protein
MKLKQTLLHGVLACLLLVPLAACQTDTSQGETGAKESPATGTKENRTLVIGMTNDVQTFDIHNHDSGTTEAVLVNMFSYLLRKDGKGGFQPELAEKYEKVNDLTWRFTLRKGVKFHNGEPFTADDVKFTLDRIIKDKTFQITRYSNIKEVKVLDDEHVDIITSEPDPVMLARMSRIGAGMLPKDYIEKVGWDEFLKKPVGTGPYQFKEWLKDDRLVLQKFDDYFAGNQFDWETVVFRKIPETSTRVGELLSGGIDLAVDMPPADWERVNAHKGTAVNASNTVNVMMLQFKHSAEFATSNPKVREAIDYAINEKLIADNLLKGQATPTRTRITPGVPGLQESLYNTYRYDPAKAKQLLKDAGYPNGLELTIQSPKNRFLLDTDIAQMIAGMLAEVGIKANVEIMESSKFTEMSDAGKNKEMMLTNYGNSFLDPSLSMLELYSKNMPKKLAGYANPKVEELIAKASFNMNEQERLDQYKQLQDIVAEDMPYLYLFHQKQFIGVNDRIQFTPDLEGKIYVYNNIKKR